MAEPRRRGHLHRLVADVPWLPLGQDPPSCLDAADAEDDGRINLRDPIYILGYLFLGGPAPPPPLGTCGPDRTADDLGCEASPACL